MKKIGIMRLLIISLFVFIFGLFLAYTVATNGGMT